MKQGLNYKIKCAIVSPDPKEKVIYMTFKGENVHEAEWKMEQYEKKQLKKGEEIVILKN